MNLPEQFYSKAFWEAVSVFLSGLLGLLVFLGYLNSEWAIPASAILAWAFAALRLIGVEPELRLRKLVAEVEQELFVLREARALKAAEVPAKKRK